MWSGKGCRPKRRGLSRRALGIVELLALFVGLAAVIGLIWMAVMS